jgi:hypothetical protein
VPLNHLGPAVGAAEVALRGVVVTLQVDEVGIDRASAAVTKHPRHLSPERTWRQQLELSHELDEVGMGSIVVRAKCDEVALDEFRDVGDGLGHDGALSRVGSWAQNGDGAGARGQGKRTESTATTEAQDQRVRCGSSQRFHAGRLSVILGSTEPHTTETGR